MQGSPPPLWSGWGVPRRGARRGAENASLRLPAKAAQSTTLGGDTVLKQTPNVSPWLRPRTRLHCMPGCRLAQTWGAIGTGGGPPPGGAEKRSAQASSSVRAQAEAAGPASSCRQGSPGRCETPKRFSGIHTGGKNPIPSQLNFGQLDRTVRTCGGGNSQAGEKLLVGRTPPPVGTLGVVGGGALLSSATQMNHGWVGGGVNGN